MKESSGPASATVDHLLVVAAWAARRGLTRGLDAATAPASGSRPGQLERGRARSQSGQADPDPTGRSSSDAASIGGRRPGASTPDGTEELRPGNPAAPERICEP